MVTALERLPVRRIARAIASAAERWSDADFPPRVRASARIAQRTGYSDPVVDYALDRLFFPLQQSALEEAIATELGSLDCLDRFVDGRRAAPVGRVTILSSRTTIGVALWPAIFALCAKCDVLVKDREDALISSFFETLCEEADEFEQAASAAAWDAGARGDDVRDSACVVAFGSNETLDAIAKQVSSRTRFIAYGSRASAGYVTRRALGDRTSAQRIAQGAARDLVLYDTEGCLSLHVLFIESGGALSPSEFAALLDEATAQASIEFPSGAARAQSDAERNHARNLAAFRAASGRGAVFSSQPESHAIVLDPPAEEPPAFLPRFLGVMTIDSPAEALHYVRDHRIPLEAVAVSEQRNDVIDMAIAAGAARIADFGELQNPPLAARHGGRPRIAEFVRWIDAR